MLSRLCGCQRGPVGGARQGSASKIVGAAGLRRQSLPQVRPPQVQLGPFAVKIGTCEAQLGPFEA